MTVNDELVDKLATLSRLEFNEEERVSLKTDLQKMISFIEKLQEVNTDDVEPLLFMSANVNVLRSDIAEGPMDAGKATSNAALAKDGYFRVPKVITKQ